MIERILRWTAVAIAVLAVIDPQLTLSGRARPRISVMTSGGGAAAASVQQAIHRDWARDFEIVDGLDQSASSVVVIGDRYPDDSVDERTKVSTVTVAAPEQRRVVINSIAVPRAVPPATTIRLRLDVAAANTRGTTSELSVRAGGAQVAHRSHTWSADAETWQADLDVVPVGDGPFVFDVRADDSQASITVDSALRLRVLVVEARPSWASAFVRRALEGDPRFDVSGLAMPSARMAVKSGASPALPSDLRAFDAVVVGGLERISTANLDLLERFARDRGGALILLPDGSIPATVTQRLIPGVPLRETLLEHPVALDATVAPKLQASELLEASDPSTSVEAIARAPSSHNPVIWSVASGDGHIVVSGATDAWRYRGSADNAFDRFWRSVVSGAALGARPAVAVKLFPERSAPGDRVRVVARVRALERNQLGDRLAISARVGAAPLRLWPDAAAGTFTGSFIVDARPNATTERVTAALADGTSDFARLAIEPHSAMRNGPPLAWLSRTHHGVDVNPSQLDGVWNHLRRTIVGEPVAAVRHPMRSPWWFAPFAACLSAEWWLRRRRGVR